MPAETPSPRKVSHPGPPVARRLAHLPASASRSLRVELAPGAVFQDALVRACDAMGVRAAAMTLLGGTFDDLAFCLPIPGDASGVVATYGEPSLARGVRLLAGTATLGRAADGSALVHCHASFCDAEGRVRGGHLLGDRCRVGIEPIVVRVAALDGVELRLSLDPETRLNKLMLPEPASHG